jgi:hypothetical protein
MPAIVKVGQRLDEQELLSNMPLPFRMTAIMYHLDPGNMYIHPHLVTKEEAL